MSVVFGGSELLLSTFEMCVCVCVCVKNEKQITNTKGLRNQGKEAEFAG